MRTKTFVMTLCAGLLLADAPFAAKPKDGPMPPFQVGITGIYAVPAKDQTKVTVDSVEPGSPAEGKRPRANKVAVLRVADGRKPTGLQYRTACAVPLSRGLVPARPLSSKRATCSWPSAA